MSLADFILERAGVPQRYRACTFDDWVSRPGTSEALAPAQGWANAPYSERGLFLYGPPGTGKTHLLAASLRVRADLNQFDAPGHVRMPRFVNVPAALDDLRASIRIRDSQAPEQWDYMRDTCPLVVLDDIGREKMTEWVAERLYALVESRYSRCLPTCASSNFTLKELDERGYGAIVSRFQETCVTVRLSATDYRPEKGRAATTSPRA